MPYKTRRQKIAAVQRRYGSAKVIDGGTYVYASKDSSAGKTQSMIGTTDGLGDLKREILKIFIISSMIIFIQICIRLTLF